MKSKFCGQVLSPSGHLLEIAYTFTLRELRMWFNDARFDRGSVCQVFYGGQPYCEWCV